MRPVRPGAPSVQLVEQMGVPPRTCRILWSMINHRLFASRLYTHCMKVAAGCAQCAVSTPPSAKKHGHLKPHPVPEHLFNRVANDFLYLGELDDEECHWTNKKVDGVLLIHSRPSG